MSMNVAFGWLTGRRLVQRLREEQRVGRGEQIDHARPGQHVLERGRGRVVEPQHPAGRAAERVAVRAAEPARGGALQARVDVRGERRVGRRHPAAAARRSPPVTTIVAPSATVVTGTVIV